MIFATLLFHPVPAYRLKRVAQLQHTQNKKKKKYILRFTNESGAASQHQISNHGSKFLTAQIMTGTPMSITVVKMHIR